MESILLEVILDGSLDTVLLFMDHSLEVLPPFSMKVSLSFLTLELCGEFVTSIMSPVCTWHLLVSESSRRKTTMESWLKSITKKRL